MATKTKGFFKKLLSTVLSAACALSGTALMGTAAMTSSITAEAATPGELPAFSWDNATVYFLLTDRFYNGNTSNDNSYGRNCDANGSPVSGWSKEAAFQGGDFAGITKKINEGYFTDLGVNAIWLSAPYEQIHGYVVGGDGNPSFAHYSYHGYYVLDYTEPDLNFGTREEFATMVETAHKNGIRVVLDIVMNHAGYQSLKDMAEFGFGPLKSGWDSYYYAHQNVNNQQYHGFIDYSGSNAQSEWAKWWGSDWIRCGLAGYTPGNDGDDIDKNLASLPDFKTGSNSQVGIPDFLKRKWQKEGTYDAKVAKFGSSNTVRGFIISWLSDWVRTYGIDGFRCDTAKHVELSAWNELKQSAKAALKEWRQNNPSAPGADWTDDFWMTGECWGHKAEKSPYFTTGGFDSMINFEFTGVGSSNTPAAGSVEGVYSRYATDFNSDPQYNMLTYLASHDTSLIKGDRNNAGSFLLMCPGGVQIYYGDEINRPVCQVNSDSDDGAGHKWRSFMNWDSMDKNTLAHWQKLGQFRNNHLSVGAGAHKLISAYDSTNGYTFARTYSKGDIDDKIVATLFASPNTQVTIDVNGIFADGTEVTNFYDETTAKVSGGKVTFNSGANGTILLQEPDGKKGSVTVKHINQDTGETIKTETLSGLLGDSYTATPLSTEGFTVAKTEGSKTGTFSETAATVTFYYTFDSDNYAYITVKYVDASSGAEIADSVTEAGKIGDSFTAVPADVKDYEFDASKSDSTTITVKKGTNTITLKYNYVEPTNAKVHYYNANGWTTVNMYAYTNDANKTQLLGVWPGKAMTSEGDGWFVCEVPDTESCRVLFNAGMGGDQEPAKDVPGYVVSGEVWIKDGKQSTASKVNVLYVSTDGKTLGTATLKGMSGETYKAEEKTFSGYTLTETPSNATGTFGTSPITVTFTYKPDKPVPEALKNTSTISAEKITEGESVKITCSSTGGNGDKEYSVHYQKSGASSWTAVKSYSSVTSVTYKPSASGTYTVRVKVKDEDETEVKKDFTLVVDPKQNDLKNTSKVSATTVAVNGTVKVTCSSTGGTGTKKYGVYYKMSGESSWTTVRGLATGTSVDFIPKTAGTYTLRVKVVDGDSNEARKDFTITATKALTNTSKLEKTSVAKGSGVKVLLSATGGKGTKKYAVYYKLSSQSTWTMAQDYETTTFVTIYPKNVGTYSVKTIVKDSSGSKTKTLTLTSYKPLANTSTVSKTTITKGDSVKVTCSSTGGTGTKQYGVWYKKSTQSTWTVAKKYSTTTTATVKPGSTGTYEIRVRVKDGADTNVLKKFTITVKAPLVNTSTIATTSTYKNTGIKVTCSSTGGVGTKKYAIWYKKSTQSSWTSVKAYGTTTTATVTPKNTGTYYIHVKVKDGNNTVKLKSFTIKSYAALVNTSKVSATSTYKNTGVKVTCASTGGIGTKKYAVWYKKSGQTSWTTVNSYGTSTTATVTPKGTGTYYIHVKVKDTKGTVKLKSFTIKSYAALVNTSKVSATSITYGNSVKVTCASTGGIGTKKYAVWYKKSGASSWTTAKSYDTTTTATVKPKHTGTYYIHVKVKDANGTVKLKSFTISVKSAALLNTSTLSTASVVKGGSFTVKCSATGGSGTKQYAVYYKKTTTSSWTTKQNYSTNTSVTIKPSSTGVYDVCIRVKDGKDTVSKSFKTVCVNSKSSSFANKSTISATSVSKGTKVTIKGASVDANDTVMYKYEYKSEDASSYTTIKDYSSSTSASFTPSKAGRYFVRVLAVDMTPTTKVKYFEVTVK